VSQPDGVHDLPWDADPIFGPTRSNCCWSATTYAGIPSNAWVVSFFDRYVLFGGGTGNIYVRAAGGGS
jgi:hypothetical protein